MAVDDKTNEQLAWGNYLAATKPLSGKRYARIEPWAWAQLRGTLDKLRPKRVTSHA